MTLDYRIHFWVRCLWCLQIYGLIRSIVILFILVRVIRVSWVQNLWWVFLLDLWKVRQYPKHTFWGYRESSFLLIPVHLYDPDNSLLALAFIDDDEAFQAIFSEEQHYGYYDCLTYKSNRAVRDLRIFYQYKRSLELILRVPNLLYSWNSESWGVDFLTWFQILV